MYELNDFFLSNGMNEKHFAFIVTLTNKTESLEEKYIVIYLSTKFSHVLDT